MKARTKYKRDHIGKKNKGNSYHSMACVRCDRVVRCGTSVSKYALFITRYFRVHNGVSECTWRSDKHLSYLRVCMLCSVNISTLLYNGAEYEDQDVWVPQC